MKEIVNFKNEMKNITEGVLHCYIHDCNNGFQQAVVKHQINGKTKTVWMACNNEESEYLILHFFN